MGLNPWAKRGSQTFDMENNDKRRRGTKQCNEFLTYSFLSFLLFLSFPLLFLSPFLPPSFPFLSSLLLFQPIQPSLSLFSSLPSGVSLLSLSLLHLSPFVAQQSFVSSFISRLSSLSLSSLADSKIHDPFVNRGHPTKPRTSKDSTIFQTRLSPPEFGSIKEGTKLTVSGV